MNTLIRYSRGFSDTRSEVIGLLRYRNFDMVETVPERSFGVISLETKFTFVSARQTSLDMYLWPNDDYKLPQFLLRLVLL